MKYFKYSALVSVLILSLFIFPKFSFAIETLATTNLKASTVILNATGLTPSSGVVFTVNRNISNPKAVPAYSQSHNVISDTAGNASSEFSGLYEGAKYTASLNYSGQNPTLQTITFTTTGTLVTNNILSLGLYDFFPKIMGVINNNSITLTLPTGTDVTSLLPIITVSNGATVSPVSGTVKNFTNPVTYTVTSYEGLKKTYTVKALVTPAPPIVKTLKITDVKKDGVTLKAEGYLPNTFILFTLKNNPASTKTPNYIKYQQVESNGAGLALATFGGMVPDGQYTGKTNYFGKNEVLGTVNFYTVADSSQIPPVVPPTPPAPDPDINAPGMSSSNGGLVPCGTTGSAACKFEDLFKLINNVVNFILFVLAIPIAAIMFAYAGILLVVTGGSSEKRSLAKSVFTNVALGLIFVAAAWLIIHTVLTIVGYEASWDTWFGL